MAITRGAVYRWAIGDETTNTVIAKATNGTFDLTNNTIEVAHKDNASSGTAWTSVDYGTKTATGTVTYFFDETDTSWETLYDNATGATKTNFIFTDNVSTNTYFKGSGVITSISKSAPVDGFVEVTANWTFDGAITKGSIV